MEGHELTLEDAGDMYSKTRERIKSLEEKAFNRLFPGYAELKNESKKLFEEQGKDPEDEDIAKRLGWSLERVISLKIDISNFENRLNSAANPADLENLVNGMPADLQNILRDIFGKTDEDIYYKKE